MMRLAAVAVVLVLAGRASAQVSEFRLGGDGQWTEAPAPQRDEAAEEITQARRLLAEGDAAGAKRILDPWIDARKRTDHPLLAEAYLLRGDARTAAGNEYKALYDYEALIKQFPGSPEFVTALERELEIAVRYAAGMNRKLWGVRWVGARGEGVELLVRIQERLPGSRLAERAAAELADAYYRQGELELAATAYEILLKNFPRGEHRRRAMLRLVYAQIARYHGPRYDASGLVEARELVEDFRASYPADAAREGLNQGLIDRIDEQRAAQMLERARFYERRKDPVASRFTLRRLAEKHPGTEAARTAMVTLDERGWRESTTAAAPPATPAPAESGATPTPSEPATGQKP